MLREEGGKVVHIEGGQMPGAVGETGCAEEFRLVGLVCLIVLHGGERVEIGPFRKEVAGSNSPGEFRASAPQEIKDGEDGICVFFCSLSEWGGGG